MGGHGELGSKPGLLSPAVLMCVSRSRKTGPRTPLGSGRSWGSQLRFVLHVPTQGCLHRSLPPAGSGRSEPYLRRAQLCLSPAAVPSPGLPDLERFFSEGYSIHNLKKTPQTLLNGKHAGFEGWFKGSRLIPETFCCINKNNMHFCVFP